MMKTSIIYFGYDIDSLYHLCRDGDFDVRGVALIPELLELRTNNPIDRIYRRAYANQIGRRDNNKPHSLSVLLRLLHFGLSPLYKKYYQYLCFLINKEIPVLSDTHIREMERADVFVVNNWWLLSKETLSLPKHGCINVHPSKLPQYRGSLPTLWSLKNRDKDSAVTYMLLNELVDSGRIIAQHPFQIHESDNAIDIEKTIGQITQDTLPQAIREYLAGDIVPYEQDELLASGTAKYYDYMRLYPLDETATEMFNKIQLYPYLNPTDKCYIAWMGDSKIHIKGCCIENDRHLAQGVSVQNFFDVYLGCKAEDNLPNTLKIRLFKDVNITGSIKFIFNASKLCKQQNKN